MNFDNTIELGDLCKNGNIKIYVPVQSLGAKEFKSDDDDLCKWTFAATNKDNFALATFGIYLIKQNLKEAERKRFAEFILGEYFSSAGTYIKFLERGKNGVFDDYRFEVGIKNGDESQISLSNTSFTDLDSGTLFLFSTSPPILASQGSIKLKDGRNFNVTPDANYLYNFIEFWRQSNLKLLVRTLK